MTDDVCAILCGPRHVSCADHDGDTGLKCLRCAGHTGRHRVELEWDNNEDTLAVALGDGCVNGHSPSLMSCDFRADL